MFRLMYVAIFREYEYLETYTALLYNLSNLSGKIYSANVLLNIS